MNYRKVLEKVKKALLKNGSECYIIRETEKEYNPSTNEYESVQTVVRGIAIQDNYQLSNIDGTVVKIGDVNLMCFLEARPFVDEHIHFGGNEFTIISVTPLNPDGMLNLYYMIQAR